MPIYMDIHIVPGVKAKEVAEAHRMDMYYQDDCSCKCMTYWIDEERESVFCLIEAPTKEAVEQLHGRAHGMIPNKIIEVKSDLVESFLGRIYDPAEAETNEDGLKIFNDPSFRVLLVARTTDPALLRNTIGHESCGEQLDRFHSTVRQTIVRMGGSEVEHGGNGFIVSFTSANKAFACALEIQKEISDKDASAIGLRLALDAGTPVEKSNQLFGDTIQFASNLSSITRPGKVGLSAKVRSLISKDQLQLKGSDTLTLSPQDEVLLKLLFEKLEANWQDPEFDVDDYCHAMAMSKSQLYRKSISLTGYSPNILLKEYRLEKAIQLMKQRGSNIAQITFDCGFTSPSYFTKCFKKKYGLLPMAYLDLLQKEKS